MKFQGSFLLITIQIIGLLLFIPNKNIKSQAVTTGGCQIKQIKWNGLWSDVRITYNAQHRPDTATLVLDDKVSDVYVFSYDESGNAVKVSRYDSKFDKEKMIYSTYKYDLHGNVIQKSSFVLPGESGHVISYKYNHQNQMTRMINADGSYTRYSYEKGNCTKIFSSCNCKEKEKLLSEFKTYDNQKNYYSFNKVLWYLFGNDTFFGSLNNPLSEINYQYHYKTTYNYQYNQAKYVTESFPVTIPANELMRPAPVKIAYNCSVK